MCRVENIDDNDAEFTVEANALIIETTIDAAANVASNDSSPGGLEVCVCSSRLYTPMFYFALRQSIVCT